MAPFDPTQFGFVLLRDFQVAGQVPVYEFNNHRVVGGSNDFLRLNLYLSTDGDYVTIWHGLLEPMFAEAECSDGRLAMVEKPADLDIFNSYNEPLFRGYIDSADAAACKVCLAARVRRRSSFSVRLVRWVMCSPSFHEG